MLATLALVGGAAPAVAEGGASEGGPEIVFGSFGSDSSEDVLGSIMESNAEDTVDAYFDDQRGREVLADELRSATQASPQQDSVIDQLETEDAGVPTVVETRNVKTAPIRGYHVSSRFNWQVKDRYTVTRCSIISCKSDAHMDFTLTTGPGRHTDKTSVKFTASSNKLIEYPTLSISTLSKGSTIASSKVRWTDLGGKTYSQYNYHTETSLIGRNVQFYYHLSVPAKDAKGHNVSGSTEFKSRTAPKCTGKTESKAFKCLFPE